MTSTEGTFGSGKGIRPNGGRSGEADAPADAAADAAADARTDADAPADDGGAGAPDLAGPSEAAAPGDRDQQPDGRGVDDAPAAGASEPPVIRLLRPRLRRVDVAVAALLALLGFAATLQLRSTREDPTLESARQEDLVRILDDVSDRNERLRREIATLQAAQDRLNSGGDRNEAALAEARRRAQVLGVLAGTLPAEGPGVVVTITDPDGDVRAEALLDALVELRDAGAEAVQLEGPPGTAVRVVASTAFVDADDGVRVDGTLLKPPYRFTVVGDPRTLASALAIPGGVIDNVESRGGTVDVVRGDVAVTALRPAPRPRYARPAEPDGS